MKEMKRWKTWKHFLVVPVFFICYMMVFSYVENRTGVKIHILHFELDRYIPFCEYFIVPYYLWFAYIAAAVVYFGLFNKNLSEYYRLILTLGIGMSLFLVISILYPNGHNLRPYFFAHDNIFVDMVKYLYSIDTSTNILPSIHVFNSVAVAIAVADCEALQKKYWIVHGSNILAFLIVCSTVFLKQHTLLDVFAAFGLNLACYLMIYRPNYATYQKPAVETRS